MKRSDPGKYNSIEVIDRWSGCSLPFIQPLRLHGLKLPAVGRVKAVAVQLPGNLRPVAAFIHQLPDERRRLTAVAVGRRPLPDDLIAAPGGFHALKRQAPPSVTSRTSGPSAAEPFLCGY